MAKQKFQNDQDLMSLFNYKSFLETALFRVKSGQSFDNWITSELIMREKLSLLKNLQEAETTSLVEILEGELKDVKEMITQGKE